MSSDGFCFEKSRCKVANSKNQSQEPITHVDDSPPMKGETGSFKKYALSFILMIAILALTFYLILKDYSLPELWSSLIQAKPIYVSAGLLMMFIYQVCVAVNIRALLRAFSGRDPGFIRASKTAYIGYYFNNVTPSASGGQPMEMFYLSRHGYPLSYTSVIFILLGLFYNIALVVVSLVLFWVRKDFILQNLDYVRYFLFAGIAFFFFMTLALFLLVYKPAFIRRVAEWALRLLKRLGLVKRVAEWEQSLEQYLSGFEHSSETFWRDPKLITTLLISSAIEIFALFSVPAWVVLALGAEPSGDIFISNVALQSVLYVSSAFVPTPGAVGVTESSFLTLFSDVLRSDQLVPAMILTRIINLYGFFIISGIISAQAFLFEKRRK